MKVTINRKLENKLLKRTEVDFTVDHERGATPTRFEVRNKLAALLGKAPETVILPKMKSNFGESKSVGIAHVYSSEKALKENEPKYLQKRFEKKEEPKAESSAEKPAEESSAEEKEAEVKEGIKEDGREEKSSEEGKEKTASN